MKTRIRWGIMGTGRIAHSFAEALQLVGEAELLAVASRTQASADHFAAEHEVARSYDSYEALTQDEDIEVIYVATPHTLHRDNVMMCLEHNKAVLCEKPFTLNAIEAGTIIKMARERQLFLMEAMWTRYLPALVKLRELLAQHTIGDVQCMLAGGAFIPEFDPDHYLFSPDLGGGVLLDAGVYLVSMASMIFGPPEEILASAVIGQHGIDEHDAFILRHSNGALASLYVSLRARSAPDLTLLGNRGRIYVHPPLFCPDRVSLQLHGEAPQELALPFGNNGYCHEVIEVNRCLREGRTESALMPLDESLRIMQTMDEMRRQIGLRYPAEA